MTAEREVVLTLKAKDTGIAVPFKELASQAKTSTQAVETVMQGINRIRDAADKTGKQVATSFGAEARKGVDALRTALAGLATETNRLSTAFEKVRFQKGSAPGAGAGGGMLAGAGGGLLAGVGPLAAAYAGFHVARNLPGLANGIAGDVANFTSPARYQNAEQGLLSGYLIGLKNSVENLASAVSGLAHAEAFREHERLDRLHLSEMQAGRASILSAASPYVEQQRQLREGLAGIQTSAALAPAHAARQLRDFQLGNTGFDLAEAMQRQMASRSAGDFAARSVAVAGLRSQYLEQFANQGQGTAETQKAVAEAKAARDRGAAESASKDAQYQAARDRANQLYLEIGQRKRRVEEFERSGWFANFLGTGLVSVRGSKWEQYKGAQTALGVTERDFGNVAANRDQLAKESQDAKQRLLDLEKQYGAAQQANAAAERERLTNFRNWARDAAKAYRDLAAQEKERLQGAGENFATADPYSRQRIKNISDKLAAGGRLNQFEIDIAGSSPIIANQFKEYQQRLLKEDPLAQQLIARNSGLQKQAEAEAARLGQQEGDAARKIGKAGQENAGAGPSIQVQIENQIKAEISTNGPALVEQLARQLEPQFKALEASIATTTEQLVNRRFRELRDTTKNVF